MADASDAASTFQPTYRAGTAARLAGVPVETLRVWERRYQVSGTRTTTRGHRQYSAEDVSRLALIKQLVDLGSPIGSIATLSLAQLRAMRSDAAAAASEGTRKGTRRIRVALVGGASAEALAGAGGLLSDLEVVAACSGPEATPDALRGVGADILAVEVASLQPEAVAVIDALVRASGARHAVVAYRFGPATAVRALRDRGFEVTRAPLAPEDLERLSRAAMGTGERDRSAAATALRPAHDIPGRRFGDEALDRLARSLTTLACECPHHVVNLLRDLAAFETYSAECANRSPTDAVLHRYLERVAGSARLLFEDALIHVARAERLELPVATQVKEANP